MKNWPVLTGAAACVLALTAMSAPAGSGTSAAGGQGPSLRHGRAHAAACAAISDPYTTAKSLLRTCGYAIYPLRKVIKNSDGSTTYVYKVDGHTVTSVLPPPGFNALKAPDSQLRRYGLPTPNMIGGGQWRKVMSHLSVPKPRDYMVGYVKGPRFRFSCRTCWAGYQADRHSDFYEAIASYREPSVRRSGCRSPQLTRNWGPCGHAAAAGGASRRLELGMGGQGRVAGRLLGVVWSALARAIRRPPRG